MKYDDMPVGTVLRCIEGEFIGTVVVRDEFGWTAAGDDGRCLPSDFGDAWVELVEKPATPRMLRDCDGDIWHLTSDGRYQCNDGPWADRAEITVMYGPLTEVTS